MVPTHRTYTPTKFDPTLQAPTLKSLKSDLADTGDDLARELA